MLHYAVLLFGWGNLVVDVYSNHKLKILAGTATPEDVGVHETRCAVSTVELHSGKMTVAVDHYLQSLNLQLLSGLKS